MYQQHMLPCSLVALLDVGVSRVFGPGAIMNRLCLKRAIVFRPRPRAAPLTAFWGTQDMQKAVDKLPRGAEICVVEGGNNRGFASYSRQPLDWEVREGSEKCPLNLNVYQAIHHRLV